jgi:hypothetical protein
MRNWKKIKNLKYGNDWSEQINVNLQKWGVIKGRTAKAYSEYFLSLQRSI